MRDYEIDELVRIIKRDNNTKRPYLLVNPLQGKHVPVSPKSSLLVFSDLASSLSAKYPGEKILLIGFAETATAIGAAIAVNCPEVFFYLHTTRECVEGAKQYLYFSEVHSHATEQKLIVDQMEQAVLQADRIVFAEDEVTTGNTINNLITQIQTRFQTQDGLRFGIVSILNSMTDEKLAVFQEQGISCTFLKRMENQDFSAEIEGYEYHPECRKGLVMAERPVRESIKIAKKLDPRLGVAPKEYEAACHDLAGECIRLTGLMNLTEKKVLVLGTEEFMYAAMYAARQIENCCGCSQVFFHATTRSPILPSGEEEYPLNLRNELRSVYEEERVTFIYNLEPYDTVIWIHDAVSESKPGILSLTGALRQAGCENVFIYKWGD